MCSFLLGGKEVPGWTFSLRSQTFIRPRGHMLGISQTQNPASKNRKKKKPWNFFLKIWAICGRIKLMKTFSKVDHAMTRQEKEVKRISISNLLNQIKRYERFP